MSEESKGMLMEKVDSINPEVSDNPQIWMLAGLAKSTPEQSL